MPRETDVRQTLTLESSDDIDYLLYCARQYPYLPPSLQESFRNILPHIKELYVGKINDVPFGVLFLTNVQSFLCLDAFRDMAIEVHPTVPLAAGRLFLNNMTERPLYSVHDKRNRAATIALKILGFRELITQTHFGQEYIAFKLGDE